MEACAPVVNGFMGFFWLCFVVHAYPHYPHLSPLDPQDLQRDDWMILPALALGC
jgi:hypothetical protein